MRPKSVRASTVAALPKQFDYQEKKVKLSRNLCPVGEGGGQLHANFTTPGGECPKIAAAGAPEALPPSSIAGLLLEAAAPPAVPAAAAPDDPGTASDEAQGKEDAQDNGGAARRQRAQPAGG